MYIADWSRGETGLSFIAEKGPNGLVNGLCSLDVVETGGWLARELNLVDGVFIVLAEGENKEDPWDEGDALGVRALSWRIAGYFESSEPFLL